MKSISETSAAILDAREDYQKDPEGSDIFRFFAKDIPDYDDDTGLFDFTVSEKDKEKKLPVYKQMMSLYNESTKKEDVSELTVFILRSLVTNPKLITISVNCGNGKKKIPPSAEALGELLSDLISCILSKSVPARISRRTAGSVVSVSGYMKKVLEITDEGIDEPGYPSYDLVKKDLSGIDTFTLKSIIENVAGVSVHNKIRDFFYNCGYREKTGDITGKMRNKSVAMLDRFAREKNISSESLDYIAFAQRSDIIGLYRELLREKDTMAFIPVASDCFGNTVIIAGSRRFPKYRFSRDLPKGSNLSCYFLLQAMRYAEGTSPNIPECRPVIIKAFESYDAALNELYSLNTDHYDMEIAGFNKKSESIISRYDRRLKGISSLLDSLTDKKAMDKEINELLRKFDEEFDQL